MLFKLFVFVTVLVFLEANGINGKKKYQISG